MPRNNTFDEGLATPRDDDDMNSSPTGKLYNDDVPYQKWRRSENVDDGSKLVDSLYAGPVAKLRSMYQENAPSWLGGDPPSDNALGHDLGRDEDMAAAGRRPAVSPNDPALVNNDVINDPTDPRYRESMNMAGSRGLAAGKPNTTEDLVDNAQGESPMGYAAGGAVAGMPSQPATYPAARDTAKRVLDRLRMQHGVHHSQMPQGFADGGTVQGYDDGGGVGDDTATGYHNIKDRFDTFDSNENYMTAFYKNQKATSDAYDRYLQTGQVQNVKLDGWKNTIGADYAGDHQKAGGGWSNAPASTQETPLDSTPKTTYSDPSDGSGSSGDGSGGGFGGSDGSGSGSGSSAFSMPAMPAQKSSYNPGGKFGAGYASGGSVDDDPNTPPRGMQMAEMSRTNPLADGYPPNSPMAMQGGGGGYGIPQRPMTSMRGMTPEQEARARQQWGSGRMDMYQGRPAIPPTPQFGRR